MSRRLPDKQWHEMQERRLQDARTDRIQREVQLAREIQQQVPGITRDEALKNAARIVEKDRTKPW